jgi:hypothetical protein
MCTCSSDSSSRSVDKRSPSLCLSRFWVAGPIGVQCDALFVRHALHRWGVATQALCILRWGIGVARTVVRSCLIKVYQKACWSSRITPVYMDPREASPHEELTKRASSRVISSNVIEFDRGASPRNLEVADEATTQATMVQVEQVTSAVIVSQRLGVNGHESNSRQASNSCTCGALKPAKEM